MTKDPVCGMQVDDKKAPATSTYKGERYVFCGQECKNKFDQNPDGYSQSKAIAAAAATALHKVSIIRDSTLKYLFPGLETGI